MISATNDRLVVRTTAADARPTTWPVVPETAVSEACDMSLDTPANDNWIHVADAIALRALRRWRAWTDYAKLAEERRSIDRVIELMTGKSTADGHVHAATIDGGFPRVASHE
jgi:hypothetical protein